MWPPRSSSCTPRHGRVGRARRTHGGDFFCALAQRGDQRDRDPLLPTVLARIGCDVLVPHATTRGLRDELSDPPYLVGIVLTGILAIFTHFFGLLLSGGVFLALLVLNRDQPARLWRVLAGIVTLGVAALGVLPFIQASIAMGKNAGSGLPAPSEGRYVMIVRLVYRLVSHPSMSAGPILVGMVLGGAVLAVLAALAPKRSSGRVTFGLLIALVSGFLVAAAAQLAQTGFQAALPSYNIWMLPALFLVMASGLAARSGLARGCAIVGIALITVGELFGVSRLATAGGLLRPYVLRLDRPVDRTLGTREGRGSVRRVGQCRLADLQSDVVHLRSSRSSVFSRILVGSRQTPCRELS